MIYSLWTLYFNSEVRTKKLPDKSLNDVAEVLRRNQNTLGLVNVITANCGLNKLLNNICLTKDPTWVDILEVEIGFNVICEIERIPSLRRHILGTDILEDSSL